MSLNTASLALSSASSQYAEAPDSTSLSITGDLTLQCWVNFTTLPTAGNQMSIIQKATSVGNQWSYAFQIFNTAGTYSLNGVTSADGNATTDVSVTWTPSIATWYHLAMVVTVGVKTQFFVAGVQQGANQAGPASIFDGTSVLRLGANQTPSQFLNGKIDDVRVYSVARTAANIASDMSKQIPPSTANLNAYWRLNNLYTDFTANANTLTPSGSPVFSTSVPFTGTSEAGFIFTII
jgi:hypothetical protein